MSDSYNRLAAVRDYWMPRVHDVDVRLTDLDEILREFVRLTRQRDALLEALRFIANHDLRGADLTVCGHIAHGLIGKARDAIKAAEDAPDL